MKIRFILLFLFATSVNMFSQSEPLVQNGIITAFDNSSHLTINYERLFIDLGKMKMSAMAGVSHSIPRYNSNGFGSYGIPVGVNLVFGMRNHHLEYGVTYRLIKRYNQDVPNFPNSEHASQMRLGYRYQSYEKAGILFRIGLAPTYTRRFDWDYWVTDLYLTPYLSLGYGF